MTKNMESIAVGLPVDPAREAVVRELVARDPKGERTGQVFRDTFDQLYDGVRTQRYRWGQLYKTEKTHFGTLLEINLQREFEYQDGEKLDYKILGHEIDAKYSQSIGGWMLPPEAVGELCMVMHADELRATFSLGVVRASEALLNSGANRDAKRTLKAAVGRATIEWVWREEPMPPNTLLHLPRHDVDAVLNGGSGTSRVIELFRRATGQAIARASIATVAHQLDITRRVRGGKGGARVPLAAEGIVVLGGQYLWQREAAEQLGLPVPRRTEYVAGYVMPGGISSTGSAAGQSGMLLNPATKETRRPFDPLWYEK